MTEPRLSAAEVAHLFKRHTGTIAVYATRLNGAIRLSDTKGEGWVFVGNWSGAVDCTRLAEVAHMALLAKGV